MPPPGGIAGSPTKALLDEVTELAIAAGEWLGAFGRHAIPGAVIKVSSGSTSTVRSFAPRTAEIGA